MMVGGYRFQSTTMKFAVVTLLAAVVVVAGTGTAAAAVPRPASELPNKALRDEFIVAMQEVEEEHAQATMERDLQRKLFSAATKKLRKSIIVRRHLEEAAGDDAGDAAVEGDDANQADEEVEPQDDYYLNAENVNEDGVDISQYALKYVGCQNIHTWDDDKASQGDATTPLAMNRFVILRLCPKDSCSAYNKLGCSANYGEYMLPMEDYLTIMAEYHFASYAKFCKACYNCMTKGSTSSSSSSSSSSSYSNGGNNRELDYSYNQYAGRDAYNNQYTYKNQNGGYYNNNANSGYSSSSSSSNNGYNNGGSQYAYSNYNANNYGGNAYGNNNANNYGGYAYGNNGGYYNNNNNGNNRNYGYGNSYMWYINGYGQCTLENVCSRYESACKNYKPNAVYYEEYFQCTDFAVGNNVGYIGPHCGSDGHTIGIAIYEDEECSTFMGDSTVIQQYTGTSYTDDELVNYYDSQCISCTASEAYALITDYQLAMQKQEENAVVEVNQLCDAMYESSAKCHKNLKTYASSYQNGENNQQGNDADTCEFITSLVENTYNENGDVALNSLEFNMANWQQKEEYMKLARKVAPYQIALLVFSLFTCLVLLAYACSLHSRLSRRRAEDWHVTSKKVKPEVHMAPPPKGADPVMYNRTMYKRDDDDTVSRVNSGIMAMRSEDFVGRASFT